MVAHQNKGYQNWLAALSQAQSDRVSAVLATLNPESQFTILNLGLSQGFIDHELKVACYTDHQLFNRYHRCLTSQRYKATVVTHNSLQNLQPGDYLVHFDHGIGRFAGIERSEKNGQVVEVVRLIYQNNALVYVSLHALHKLSKYRGQDDEPPVLSKLGGTTWQSKKQRIKQKLKTLATDLAQLYGRRRQAEGHAFASDTPQQAALESSFMYEDTPDQEKAAAAIKHDMEQAYPMDRLICGDVGFGKTELAVRAAFKAVQDGKQVAILVPTTVLAMQHYRVFRKRLTGFRVQIACSNRFESPKQAKATLENLAKGNIHIIIGTHRLLSKQVQFHDLGLLIVDEEQKFGVAAKEHFKQIKLNIDILTLTATPIPRTLQFSMMGARDLSILRTPPPNRRPIVTALHTIDDAIIQKAITQELQRGGQVFLVHNRVANIEQIANKVQRLVPNSQIGVAHGQMNGSKLEQQMLKFIDGSFDILVATNIIESGLDIPNANTIIIYGAQQFGLADLHQLRGRVGRSNQQAFCYLLIPPLDILNADARKRMQALMAFAELGDGFRLAMRDLDIRGAGNILGAEQSGLIADVGFEVYQQLLAEAIQEVQLKQPNAADVSSGIYNKCMLETDLPAALPTDYVANDTVRLNLYFALDRITNTADLQAFEAELIDRFGPLPQATQALLATLPLRWEGQALGFSKLKIKRGKMYCYAPAKPDYVHSSMFGRLLTYIQRHSHRCRLEETEQQMVIIIDQLPSFATAQSTLQDMRTETACTQ